MSCTTTSTPLSYLKGSSAPTAVLELPGAGSVDSFDSWALRVAVGEPGGETKFVVPQGQLAAGVDQLTVTWSSGDLATLDEGVYGLVAECMLDGRLYKWDGLLEIRAA